MPEGVPTESERAAVDAGSGAGVRDGKSQGQGPSVAGGAAPKKSGSRELNGSEENARFLVERWWAARQVDLRRARRTEDDNGVSARHPAAIAAAAHTTFL